MSYKNLLTPLKIGGVTIKNRMIMGAAFMAEIGPNGIITEQGINYYVERAKGGFGLLMQGAVWADMDVEPACGAGSACPWHDPFTFSQVTKVMLEKVHSYGAKMFVQVTMGFGRNNPGLLTPSEVPSFFDPSYTHTALTTEQIKQKIAAVVKTCAFMKECGYDGVEIHAMHWGYLLDQMAMAITNQRTDEYGGSLENRLRAAKEIVEGVKAACGKDFPVTMKLGLKSYIKGFNQPTLNGENEAGRTLEEALEIIKLLQSYGYDAITANSGIYDSWYRGLPPSYAPKGEILELTQEAMKVAKIPILALGRMNDPDLAERAIAEGKCDAVVMSRAAMADSEFASKVQSGKVEKIRPCLSCNMGCNGRAMLGMFNSCVVNPACSRELSYGISPAIERKKIAVIGGGVAGMELARTAKLRGHDVEIYEAKNEMGGNAIAAGTHHFKAEIKDLIRWYQLELKDLGVPVHMGMQMDAEKIKALGADAVVLAVGSDPIMPASIPGINHAKTLGAIEAVRGFKPVGDKVVIVGGGLTGVEYAVDLGEQGKDVTVVEMLDAIMSTGPAVPIPNAMMLNLLLAEYKVNVLTGTALVEINDEGAVVKNVKTGEISTIPADNVVMSIGFKPKKSIAEELYGNGFQVFEIGDARMVANIHNSIWDAYELARNI